MTKINNKIAYSLKIPVALTDYVIGSNDERTDKQTRNFQMSNIRDLFLDGLNPEIGGNLKVTEITAETELTNPAEVANLFDPPYIVSQYEFLALNINDVKWLLKLQNITVGIDEEPIEYSDFILIKQVLDSSTLTITKELDEDDNETGKVLIDAPETSDIPRLIVNSAYTGTDELGTLSKPFKSIQAAWTAFVGDGTNEEPEMAGSEIVIQKGSGVYTYTGNFNYNDATVILEEGTVIYSNPTTGTFLCDFDSLSNIKQTLNIILKDSAVLQLEKSGFRNAGTTIATSNRAVYKQITFSGTGRIAQTNTSLTNTYTIFESNYTSNNTHINDGVNQFDFQGILIGTATQSIYKIGGNSQMYFNDCRGFSVETLPSLSTATVFFNQLGGQVLISGGGIAIAPFYAVTLDKIFPLSKSASIPCVLQLSNVDIQGRMTTFISNETAEQSTAGIFNLSSRINLLQCVNVAKSPSVLWTNFVAYNNIFVAGQVDVTQVDMTSANTRSAYNIFGGNVVESLRKYDSRAAAVSAGLKKGDRFINTSAVASPTTGWITDMIME